MSLVEKIRERLATVDFSKYAGIQAVLQYNIMENGSVAAVFAIDVSTGKFTEGKVNGADATFTMEFSDYLALQNNTESLANLMDKGKVAVEGNRDLVITLDEKRRQ